MPHVKPDARSDAFSLHELERHQHRREQGIPTLTVLAGPPGSAASLWRRWLEPLHRPTCMVPASSETEVVRAWVETLARGRDLAADAADFLGAAAGLAPGELPARLAGKTAHERDVLLQELLPSAPDGDASTACRCLLQPQVIHKSGSPFDALLEACEHDPFRVLAAVHALVPPRAAPSLLLTGSGAEAVTRAARVAAKLCAANPSLVIALSADRPSIDAYLHGGRSQALAMVREGLIELATPTPEALGRKLETLGVTPSEELSAPLARLAADGVSDEVLTLFGEMVREHQRASREGEPVDRARSTEERFLYTFLDSHPATHGLFELNASPGFRLAGRDVEVDLLSRQLSIAVEIDGYFHFHSEEAYRRDRRKDLALQRHGYWVLRFLAGDVVERLEEILDTLSQVIQQRREALMREPSRQEAGPTGSGRRPSSP
uniref:Restriction endonuclease n=1 Tax=Vitiosangium cumulatum TaxID=1867796 RepID=A0A7D5BG52_9BACT|nr:restriction endonuclease [Vitiosangium cumulatum]